MEKSKLSDGEWTQLMGRLKKTPGIRVGCEVTCRRFVQAVLWILRAGAQWRLLPDGFGHWNSVLKHFANCSRFGVREKILAFSSCKADLEKVYAEFPTQKRIDESTRTDVLICYVHAKVLERSKKFC